MNKLFVWIGLAVALVGACITEHHPGVAPEGAGGDHSGDDGDPPQLGGEAMTAGTSPGVAGSLTVAGSGGTAVARDCGFELVATAVRPHVVTETHAFAWSAVAEEPFVSDESRLRIEGFRLEDGQSQPLLDHTSELFRDGGSVLGATGSQALWYWSGYADETYETFVKTVYATDFEAPSESVEVYSTQIDAIFALVGSQLFLQTLNTFELRSLTGELVDSLVLDDWPNLLASRDGVLYLVDSDGIVHEKAVGQPLKAFGDLTLDRCDRIVVLPDEIVALCPLFPGAADSSSRLVSLPRNGQATLLTEGAWAIGVADDTLYYHDRRQPDPINSFLVRSPSGIKTAVGGDPCIEPSDSAEQPSLIPSPRSGLMVTADHIYYSHLAAPQQAQLLRVRRAD